MEKDKNKPYQPIACSIYDELELLAMRKESITLTYKEEGKEITIKTLIVDLFTKEKEEFLVIENKQVIRLDNILLINDKPIAFKC